MVKVKKYLDEIIYSNYFIGLVAVIVALSWLLSVNILQGYLPFWWYHIFCLQVTG